MAARDPIYNDPALVQFYDAANSARDDYDMCLALAAEGPQPARTVLDLGCGTGTLAAEMSARCTVTGVDPAAAMLNVARKRPNGGAIRWVQADARDVRLGERFDLVVLTGHVFQVFLTPQDRSAVLRTIAAHLAPGGRFIFDTRKPDFPAPKERSAQASQRMLNHPDLGQVLTWNTSQFDPTTSVLNYQNHFQVISTGQVHSAGAQIAYPSKDQVATQIQAAGLTVDRWLGDWHGGTFTTTAREIIPIGRRVSD